MIIKTYRKGKNICLINNRLKNFFVSVGHYKHKGRDNAPLTTPQQNKGKNYCRANPLRGHDRKATEAFQELSLGCMLRRKAPCAQLFCSTRHCCAVYGLCRAALSASRAKLRCISLMQSVFRHT